MFLRAFSPAGARALSPRVGDSRGAIGRPIPERCSSSGRTADSPHQPLCQIDRAPQQAQIFGADACPPASVLTTAPRRNSLRRGGFLWSMTGWRATRAAFAPRLFAWRWSTAVEMPPGPNPTGASVSGTKNDCSWGSMDKGRPARAQGAFEISNAAIGDREEDETNRAGAPAKGGNSRHRPGSSPLIFRSCKSVTDPLRWG